MKIPRILIAGTHSGCGKTTVATGIMYALSGRGIKVQPFKTGPDYIDPMFHTFITGRNSRNLDSWILQEDMVQQLFTRNVCDADIAVIEGMMGLYDGCGSRDDAGSTAHVSKITGSPVILVVDGEGMSRSAAALVQGFRDFDPLVDIRGVIINNIYSRKHYELLKDIIESSTGISVVGFLRKMKEYCLENRHLGLVTSAEISDLKDRLEFLRRQVEETVDLELVFKIAKDACGIESVSNPINACGKAKIAVAKDRAFSFYYQDNLDLLEMLGAELAYFSPLSDSRLPEGIDGMYLGGGYPEVFAGELEENRDIREAIRTCTAWGMPAYAECGGLMYMCQSIYAIEGREYKMVGALPGISRMTASLQRFGYVDIEVSHDNLLAKRGMSIRGHEFHFSVTDVEPDTTACYRVVKDKGTGEMVNWECGFKAGNLLAGYPHLHFWANTEFAKNFIYSCELYKSRRADL